MRRWTLSSLSVIASASCFLHFAGSLGVRAAALSDVGARVEGANSEALSSGIAQSWRVIRSSGVNGAPDSAAILHVADFQQSDPRLAGLMLRCSKKGIETIIVVVEPFPPQSRPKITLRAAGQEFYFVGSVLATGAGLLLPADGMDLAMGPWRGADELSIKVSEGDAEIEGVVKLSGLTAAIQSLADCAAK